MALIATLVASDDTAHDHEHDDKAPIDPKAAEQMTRTHNELRGNVYPSATNMLQLTYDQGLADLAQQWSAQCKYSHNPAASTADFENVGENLFLSTKATNASFDLHTAALQWWSERDLFDYRSNSCEEGQVCSHYTQMVWAESRAIGCGMSICKNLSVGEQLIESGQIIVCNYGPRGNIVDVLPYKEGSGCSECPEGKVCVCGAAAVKLSALVAAMALMHVLFVAFF